jgi:5-methylcytosine-specific restriction protein A
VTRGRCETHAPKPSRTTAERGYGSRWQRLRPFWLAKYPHCGDCPNGQRPVMSRCFEQGLVTPAIQIDHVVPHKGNQQLFWDSEGNWQALCSSCGTAKSARGL